ncbi:acetyl-coenzyme A synthetase N-terminal domain-containing protein [Methanolobus sp. WCC4]|uniref:acetyl-coenzyme A synthetase N-terminal domain-containing protein n=1 Tax=Methanolobus sp. WCC4 TaxID=3125784 RepID=UPI0030FCBA96
MSDNFDVKLDSKNYYPDPSAKENSWIQDYEKIYSESLKDPEKHWDSVAEELGWFKLHYNVINNKFQEVSVWMKL